MFQDAIHPCMCQIAWFTLWREVASWIWIVLPPEMSVIARCLYQEIMPPAQKEGSPLFKDGCHTLHTHETDSMNPQWAIVVEVTVWRLKINYSGKHYFFALRGCTSHCFLLCLGGHVSPWRDYLWNCGPKSSDVPGSSNAHVGTHYASGWPVLLAPELTGTHYASGWPVLLAPELTSTHYASGWPVPVQLPLDQFCLHVLS